MQLNKRGLLDFGKVLIRNVWRLRWYECVYMLFLEIHVKYELYSFIVTVDSKYSRHCMVSKALSCSTFLLSGLRMQWPRPGDHVDACLLRGLLSGLTTPRDSFVTAAVMCNVTIVPHCHATRLDPPVLAWYKAPAWTTATISCLQTEQQTTWRWVEILNNFGAIYVSSDLHQK